jgi:glutamine synthetase
VIEEREDAAAQDAAARLGDGVSSVRIVYADLHGVQRGKDVPRTEFADVAGDGVTFCWAVMGTDLRHTPVVGGEVGYPDMVAVPDLSTLVEVPWEPDIAMCLSDLERLPSREPEPTDPRGAVRRAQQAFEELGFAPSIGPELEFFLLAPDPERPGQFRRYVDNLSMVYTVGRQADPRNVLRRLLEGCAGLGLGAFAANHEYMNSQYEINLRHGPALDAADRAFLLKASVKEVSVHHGLLATFIGKPFNDQGGSGFHVHLSLEKDGRNAFDDPEGEDGLSPEVRSFTAGVLEHAQACMAFLNPTINAFRRITPDSLAPTHANWGIDNRTTYVRIPPERGKGARIEVRIGDGSANPYLGIAALLFAGLDGMRRGLDPGPPKSGDVYRAEEPGSALPPTLSDALDALEGDAFMVEAMGPELVSTFVAMKRFEIERYRHHVSDWDLDEYLHHL